MTVLFSELQQGSENGYFHKKKFRLKHVVAEFAWIKSEGEYYRCYNLKGDDNFSAFLEDIMGDTGKIKGMFMEGYNFERKRVYQLVAINDKAGNDKSNSNELYQERLGCFATNLHYDDYPCFDGQYCMNMSFVQNENGKPIFRGLHTSAVSVVEETENGIIIYTRHTIYVFMNAELKEIDYKKNEQNLVELYMSLADDFYFGKGFYYDEKKIRYELVKSVNVSMIQDSVRLGLLEKCNHHEIKLGYFPIGNSVEFYDISCKQQKIKIQILIHNTGKKEMSISFAGKSNIWTVKPGESIKINPHKI